MAKQFLHFHPYCQHLSLSFASITLIFIFLLVPMVLQQGSSLSPSSPWTSSSPSSSSSSSSPWSCSRAGGAQLAQWGSCRLHYYLALTHTHTNLPTYLYPFQNTLKDAHSNIYSGKIITVLIKRCAFLALAMFISTAGALVVITV